ADAQGTGAPTKCPFHARYYSKLRHARATTGRYPRATPWPARERDSEQGRWGSAKSSRPDSENYVSTTYTPSATIVAWRSAESDPLVKLANLNMQPAFRITFHIGADPSTRISWPLLLTHRIAYGPVAEPNAINPRCASRFMSSFKPCCRHALCFGLGINFHQFQFGNIPL